MVEFRISVGLVGFLLEPGIVAFGLRCKLSVESFGLGDELGIMTFGLRYKLSVVCAGQQNGRDALRYHESEKTNRQESDAGFHRVLLVGNYCCE